MGLSHLPTPRFRVQPLPRRVLRDKPPPLPELRFDLIAIRAMSRKAAISAWGEKWHASELTSRTYTEDPRGPPDGRPSEAKPQSIANAKPEKKPTRS